MEEIYINNGGGTSYARAYFKLQILNIWITWANFDFLGDITCLIYAVKKGCLFISTQASQSHNSRNRFNINDLYTRIYLDMAA